MLFAEMSCNDPGIKKKEDKTGGAQGKSETGNRSSIAIYLLTN